MNASDGRLTSAKRFLIALLVVALVMAATGGVLLLNGARQVRVTIVAGLQLPGAPVIDKTVAESYNTIVSTANLLAEAYPDLVTVGSAGQSAAGRDLVMLKVGTGDKKALVVGAVHAREHLTTKFLLCLVNDYCIAYQTGAAVGTFDVKTLLEAYTLYVLPCANPDGLEIVFSRETPDEGVTVSALDEYKANKAGIDINRNFPLNWEGLQNGVTAPADYWYKGAAPADAVETQALMDLCDANDFAFLLSVHVKGDVIFWGNDYDPSGSAASRDFAKALCKSSGFAMTDPLTDPNDYAGGFEDWFRFTYGRPGVCVELVDTGVAIQPCGNANYADFDGTVQYSESYTVVAAAMNYMESVKKADEPTTVSRK